MLPAKSALMSRPTVPKTVNSMPETSSTAYSAMAMAEGQGDGRPDALAQGDVAGIGDRQRHTAKVLPSPTGVGRKR